MIQFPKKDNYSKKFGELLSQELNENINWAMKGSDMQIPSHLSESPNNIVQQFVQFVSDNFKWNNNPSINIVDIRDGNMTHGSYDPNKNEIKVYGKNRSIADILRSLAHELVHHNQNINQKINGPVPEIGGPLEDEANALAGQLVKAFGKNNPNIY